MNCIYSFCYQLSLHRGHLDEILIQWSDEMLSYASSKSVKSIKKQCGKGLLGQSQDHICFPFPRWPRPTAFSNHKDSMILRLLICKAWPLLVNRNQSSWPLLVRVSMEVLCIQISMAESAHSFWCAVPVCVNQKVKQFLFQYWVNPISAVSTFCIIT